MAASETIQTIARLTPLAEVLAMVDLDVKPVTPRTIDVTAGAGRTLAVDAVAPVRPNSAMALLDGWALSADATLGAGGYSPVLLAQPPQRVEVGQPMPPDTDSVAPFDAVKVNGGRAEALVTVNPGDGVLPAGGDCDPAMPLRRSGERLRATDLAALAAAGVARVTAREPRIRVLALRGSVIINAAARLVASDIERRGGAARLDEAGRDLGVVLAAETADAIVVIGGTGQGRNDNSVQLLARAPARIAHADQPPVRHHHQPAAEPREVRRRHPGPADEAHVLSREQDVGQVRPFPRPSSRVAGLLPTGEIQRHRVLSPSLL